MTLRHPVPTGREVFFDESELIVSKTDLKGTVTYANNVFLKVSGYKEEELLNQPHSILRHPDMPRCAFKLLWQEIEAGREIFAYVINLAKNGDHYWVFAHVTPTIKDNGSIIGYHSSRRVPSRTALGKVIPLYKQLLEIERGFSNQKEGMNASFSALVKILEDAKISYEEFVFSL
jgi:PAS domain S-box-containing protein